jgi:hypothetical protein
MNSVRKFYQRYLSDVNINNEECFSFRYWAYDDYQAGKNIKWRTTLHCLNMQSNYVFMIYNVHILKYIKLTSNNGFYKNICEYD